MKESIQRAFAYLQGQKVKMGVGQQIDTTDFHVEAIDLLNNRVSCEAGIALVVAVYSAVKKHSVLPGLLILGDLSIQGNIKAVRSLAEPLQVGMDNGARRALDPAGEQAELPRRVRGHRGTGRSGVLLRPDDGGDEGAGDDLMRTLLICRPWIDMILDGEFGTGDDLPHMVGVKSIERPLIRMPGIPARGTGSVRRECIPGLPATATGIHRVEEMYEVGGFIVNFFYRAKVDLVSQGCALLSVDEFEEGGSAQCPFLTSVLSWTPQKLNSTDNSPQLWRGARRED